MYSIGLKEFENKEVFVVMGYVLVKEIIYVNMVLLWMEWLYLKMI